MDEEVVVLASVTLWLDEKVPPLGEMTGAAAVSCAFSRP